MTRQSVVKQACERQPRTDVGGRRAQMSEGRQHTLQRARGIGVGETLLQQRRIPLELHRPPAQNDDDQKKP